MNLHLVVLLSYAAVLMGLGLWLGTRVRHSSDFFVASRRLGPFLMCATMLAANIGAGSTVNAAGLGYRDGLSAWWWVGSAGLGSIALAFWVGPRIRRLAAKHELHTVGELSRTPVRKKRPGNDLSSTMDRNTRDPGRSADGDRSGAECRDRDRAVGWLCNRWSRRHGVLHRRRFAHRGVGQRRAACGASDRLRRRRAACVERGGRLGPRIRGHERSRWVLELLGGGTDPVGFTSPGWVQRSSSRPACCKRSTGRVTIERCGWALASTPAYSWCSLRRPPCSG